MNRNSHIFENLFTYILQEGRDNNSDAALVDNKYKRG